MDKELLDKARGRTTFNDIENFNFETVTDTEYKFFCKECYKVVDADTRADILADFTVTNDACLLDPNGMLNHNWLYEFELYLLYMWKEELIQYLSGELSVYENDVCNEVGCSW
jgi:hypothetical protein